MGGCCCPPPEFVPITPVALLSLKQNKKIAENENDLKIDGEQSFTRDGLKFYVRCWAILKPEAVVFLVHGFGEHVDRYDQFARFLNHHGYSVFGMDHRGHGKSEGVRVDINHFSDYVNDYISFIQHIETNVYPFPKPAFLFGHSMGGLIASVTGYFTYQPAVENKEEKKSDKIEITDKMIVWPWKGVVLSAPAIMPHPDTANCCWRGMARLAFHCCPLFAPKGINPDFLSHDKEEVKKYVSDPLNWHGGMRARWGMEMLVAMNFIRSKAKEVKYPLLVCQGTNDALVAIEGSSFFVDHVSSPDKEYKPYEKFYHELFHEPERQQVYDHILGWLNKRK